jgi:hypothetical protein
MSRTDNALLTRPNNLGKPRRPPQEIPPRTMARARLVDPSVIVGITASPAACVALSCSAKARAIARYGSSVDSKNFRDFSPSPLAGFRSITDLNPAAAEIDECPNGAHVKSHGGSALGTGHGLQPLVLCSASHWETTCSRSTTPAAWFAKARPQCQPSYPGSSNASAPPPRPGKPDQTIRSPSSERSTSSARLQRQCAGPAPFDATRSLLTFAATSVADSAGCRFNTSASRRSVSTFITFGGTSAICSSAPDSWRARLARISVTNVAEENADVLPKSRTTAAPAGVSL